MDNHTINVLYVGVCWFLLLVGIYYTEYGEYAVMSQLRLAKITALVAAISAAVIYFA